MPQDQSEILREIETVLQQITDDSCVSIKRSSIEKFIGFLQKIQRRGNLPLADKEKIKQKPVETLRYMLYSDIPQVRQAFKQIQNHKILTRQSLSLF